MVDLKETRTKAEIVVIIALMVSLGVNVMPNDQAYDPFTCDIDTIPDMMCYKLSRVNDYGIQRNCYYDRDNSRSYRVCTAGWNRIEEIDVNNNEECKPIILAYTDNGRYICNGVGPNSQCYSEDMNLEKFENIG